MLGGCFFLSFSMLASSMLSAIICLVYTVQLQRRACDMRVLGYSLADTKSPAARGSGLSRAWEISHES